MIPTESVVKYACIAGKAVNGGDRIVKARMTKYPTHGFSDLLSGEMQEPRSWPIQSRLPRVPGYNLFLNLHHIMSQRDGVSCKLMD